MPFLGFLGALALAASPFQGQPAPAPTSAGQVDVPLSRLPNSGDIGTAAGVAFLDYDGDGWIDLFSNFSGGLWRNQGGAGFTRVADLDAFRTPTFDRYGASAGDYDNDGLPDLACEPRGDCFQLLRNLDGAANFLEVASDPQIVFDAPPCTMFAETFCWGDVDEDGDLDLFATAYQDEVSPGSGGNRFFENLGPSGPGGAYRLAERTAASGLGIPANVSRPEGAQFVDIDRDGDLDAYANGTLYQNVTAGSGPRFEALVRTPTGISLAARLDEGVTLFDYDLDGDQDLFVLYKGFGNRIWENEGDGTFFEAAGVIELPSEGSSEGCSAEDWDLDGDLDLTTGHVFRRNLLVEAGQRYLRLATHAIPDRHIDFLTPAWGDWDKDGDPDVVLANWRGTGRFYQNDSYGPGTDALHKLSLRVRPLADSPLVPRGLETEYGATVEVRVHDDPRGFVRRRFTASSHGYLQQSEYALTFALPPGPLPEAPARGVLFDLAVDFPSRAERGILRIDASVNPVLGSLELASLQEREIAVFRSGRVRIDGLEYAPSTRFSARLVSSGALVLPAPGVPLAEPVATSAPEWLVGLEFDSHQARGALRLEELVLDGQLAPAGPQRCDANVLLWDVTPGEAPRLLRTASLATSPRNDRSFLTLGWLLKPARVYRLACRVSELRHSPLLSVAGAALEVRGALSFAQPARCEPAALLNAPLIAGETALELRYRTSVLAPAPAHR